MRLKFFYSMCVAIAVLFALVATPAYAQVKVEDLGYHQPKPLEPGGDVQMVASPDTDDGQAALGDGHIVFKFQVTDVDPIADDASDVVITCIIIQNMGTATGGGTSGDTGGIGVSEDDIAQVMVLDEDSNSVAAPITPTTVGATGGTSSCDEVSRTNNPGNAQITWEAFFTNLEFVIPDDSMEIFQVAVRTEDTDALEDESQNHTLNLHAIIVVDEVVGSPPAPTTFVEAVMDSSMEVIWNGGINSWTEDTYVINPIMPGDSGVVSAFTICDYDANEHQLVLNRFWVKQYEQGTAISSDLVALSLYRVEGFTRTLVATRTPDGDFHRSSGAADGMPLPGGDNDANDNTTDPRFVVTIPDDTCYKFELEAKVSQFAFKGHIIQPRIQISAEEPRGTPIDDTVNPEIRTKAITMIGKGLIKIPDTNLIGKPGIVPLMVQGVQLPGFGTLQVGPYGALNYNPNVIQVKSIKGVAPYVVDATEIDNRNGEARFSVRIDPVAGNPLLTAVQNGTVAEIRVEPVGKPGTMTRLMLTYDCFELVAQMNCVPVGFPFPDKPNQSPNNDISIMIGKVNLVHPGDIDLDGQPTVSDAVKLATAILPCTEEDGEIPMPEPMPRLTPVPFDKTIEVELTDEQKSIADVARPFAEEDEIPDCSTLTSADVAEIARFAINFGDMPAPKSASAASASVANVSTQSESKPWYNFITEFWNWVTGATVQQAHVSLSANSMNQSFDIAIEDVPGAALGGIQGRIYFDPNEVQVDKITGINGYQVLAANINPQLGEIRFVALAPKGQGLHNGNIIRLTVNDVDDLFTPTLAVEMLIDENGEEIPFSIAEEQGFALNPVPLKVSSVQALNHYNGTYQFRALGEGITGIQVQVFDLAGGKLFDRKVAGNSLMFQALTKDGKPMANGVYLYVVTAKGFHGDVVRSEVKKLVILR